MASTSECPPLPSLHLSVLPDVEYFHKCIRNAICTLWELEHGYFNPQARYFALTYQEHRRDSVAHLWEQLSEYPKVPWKVKFLDDRIEREEVTNRIQERGSDDIAARLYKGQKEQKRDRLLPLVTQLSSVSEFPASNVYYILRDRQLDGKLKPGNWRRKYDAIPKSYHEGERARERAKVHHTYYVEWYALSEIEDHESWLIDGPGSESEAVQDYLRALRRALR